MAKLYRSGELDMAFDDSMIELQGQMAERFGVFVEVVQAHGPAGGFAGQGWPIVRLVGTLDAISRAVGEAWGDDMQDAVAEAVQVGVTFG